MFDKIDGIHYEDEQAIAYLPVPRAPWRHFVRQRPKLKNAIVLGHHVKVPYQYCDYWSCWRPWRSANSVCEKMNVLTTEAMLEFYCIPTVFMKISDLQ